MGVSLVKKIAGVYGYPIGHTLSPLFQNAAFKELGLNFIYLPFLVKPKDLKKAIEAIKALNMVGVNITVPYKRAVLPYLDELSPEASKIGAVNTIHHYRGKLIGYNTDGEGFINSLKEEGNFEPEGKNVYLLGAGGAAYGIAFSLIKAGIKSLTLTNRTKEKGELLLKHLKKFSLQECILRFIEFNKRNSATLLKEIDLLVNATSVGMNSDDPLLINFEIFSREIFVYDIVYNKDKKTRLIEAAEERKFPYLEGEKMLVYQGAISFEIWTKRKAPIEVMKRAIKEKNAKVSYGW